MDPLCRLITLLLLTDGQDFQRAQEQSAREVCEREGFEFEVAYADNSPFMQIQQALEYIDRPMNMRPAVIAVELASTPAAFTQVAKSALSVGIGWVELSSGVSAVDSLRHEYPGHLVATVTVDEDAIGELQAAQCRALMPTGGTVLYVEGPNANPVVKTRRAALEKGLHASSITIGKTICADWTEEGATQATLTWLQQASASRIHPTLICSQNDAMALGVRKAARLKRTAWSGIPAIGCDGLTSVGQRYVKEGTLAATVVKPVTAGPAIEWVMRRLKGEKLPRHLTLHPTSFPTLEQLTHA